ncbi:MAG: glucose-6-phosphate dehydrogenase [Bdellovibrio sp. 28-41-41]|nr:MAG: glucose-6-phosphate dehydrogenase [Bdellovibrio sp. 28-41-41]
MTASMALAATDMVIFGGMGDLSLRKIMPALYYRFQEKQWNSDGRIFLLGRTGMDEDSFKKHLLEHGKNHIKEGDFDENVWNEFTAGVHYVLVNSEKSSSFDELKKIIDNNPRPVRVFYLATPASIFGKICHQLKSHELITPETRVVIEKPLGSNLESFKSINNSILECFQESQVYRIDHYLGKETVQNLMVLRFANNIFERLWNSDTVDHVQITVAESIGVGTRGGYYDESGALRDMVQNHLLQLLCLVAMEAPSHITPDFVRDEKLKVLNSLRPISENECQQMTVRGQYRSGSVNGEKVNGYTEDLGKTNSKTETYVALKAYVDNWRWSGVPFYLRTGKRMEQRYSEIVIQFRPVPLNIFPGLPSAPETNKLIIRLQPDESVKLQMTTKVPGPGGYRLQPVYLNLSFAETFDHRLPEAYERLLMDIVRGNPTLFMRSDEVQAAWKWSENILEAWKDTNQTIQSYAAGSAGPADAAVLLARDGAKWHEEF